MSTLSISPKGEITLPQEVLQIDTWKNNSELELFCVGDTIILRPSHYQKSDTISDLGGFFKDNTIVLTTKELCKPVELDKE